MDIVKKNLLSIVCGVVVLAAVVAYFVLVSGEEQKLQAHLQARKAVYDKLEQVRTQPRKRPVINPDDPAQEDLKVFPSEPIIKQGEEAQKKVTEEATKAIDTAIRINRHEPLLREALLLQRDRDRYQFRDVYIQRLGIGRAKGNPQSIQVGILKGGFLPTPEDVTRVQNELWEKEFKPKINPFAPTTSEQSLRQQWTEACLNLPQQMRDDVIKNSKVYLNADALDYNARITVTEAPDPVNIWWAQLGLWVQEDIAKVIARTNEAAPNVTEAPIKRLLKLQQPKSFVAGAVQPGAPAPGVAPAPGAGGMADCNALDFQGDIPTDAPAEFVAPTSVSFTDRTSNEMYDVVHLAMLIDVEAAKIPQVLAELSRNQYIYVLRVGVENVDSLSERAAGYEYGSRPVVRLTIECEELFLRAWTINAPDGPLMPKLVRDQYGIQVQKPAAVTQ